MKLKIILLNVFIVFYVSVMFFSGVPETNVLDARLKHYSTKVAMLIGIWPSWSMFAPNPIKFDSKTYMTITFKDDSKMELDLEKKLDGIFAEFRKARWMKFVQDNLRSPQQRALLGPVLRHYYSRFNTESNPIKNMTITRKWNDITPLKDGVFPITNTPRISNEAVLISHNIGDN